ncbi:HemK2/MTQ2 family protein methyltransferase [Candidatus Mycobacterium methanotrophicum]|uniref:Class I SAM-dependent methyltransferase n=1 Tax=Candidatus Mycobacterium methanotrophicum TaxID=2943498 RepID=A0ABY4QF56_9MYCO|nr:HemK2/MTQ2 family protein methyltransferase [Candidatus Mycobacterium methanotrophicum]UQX09434.1 class I SAM-dependent methyltransferase [Candidatus Mycobacterium methanotrophicum]
MTVAYPAPCDSLDINGVYPPQHDSQLLIDTLEKSELVAGRRVLDLCTGSGVVAIAAAELGAASVTAFDICPHAVHCSRGNAVHAGVEVNVHVGSSPGALDYAPFDVIVSNPPYVPTPPAGDTEVIPITAGPPGAWNAGVDGRTVLDPLCESAAGMLAAGGSLLLVQSALSGVEQSLESLRSTGLKADVVAYQCIPFGPVLSARAGWLEVTGRIQKGCRIEELAVIRADKP